MGGMDQVIFKVIQKKFSDQKLASKMIFLSSNGPPGKFQVM